MSKKFSFIKTIANGIGRPLPNLPKLPLKDIGGPRPHNIATKKTPDD